MNDQDKLKSMGQEAESQDPTIDPQEFEDAMDLAMSPDPEVQKD
jgi:hypothetical protein